MKPISKRQWLFHNMEENTAKISYTKSKNGFEGLVHVKSFNFLRSKFTLKTYRTNIIRENYEYCLEDAKVLFNEKRKSADLFFNGVTLCHH